MRLVMPVSLAILSCSSTTGHAPAHDSSFPADDAVPPMPDVVDYISEAGPELVQGTDADPDVDLTAILDAQAPDLAPDASQAVDLLPEVSPAARTEVSLEATPPDVAVSFSACLYLGTRVGVMKAGTYCGRYPQLGPSGTILCYVGCTVESISGGTPPANAKADATTDGYCSSNVDDYASSGSTLTRLGLCFETAATCATTCP